LDTFDGIVYAHETFDFLLHGEFPEGRMVALLKEAEAEISNLPWSPGEEGPNVSSRQQVMTLFRHYTLNRPAAATTRFATGRLVSGSGGRAQCALAVYISWAITAL
jgi:hypothetical protein